MATAEQFQTILKAAPFKPFEFRLADGRSYAVHHPEFFVLAPGPRARAGIFFEADGETMHLLDLGLVTEIVARVPADGPERRPAGARDEWMGSPARRRGPQAGSLRGGPAALQIRARAPLTRSSDEMRGTDHADRAEG